MVAGAPRRVLAAGLLLAALTLLGGCATPSEFPEQVEVPVPDAEQVALTQAHRRAAFEDRPFESAAFRGGLAHTDPAVRRLAVRFLRQVRLPDATALLLTRLAVESDPDVLAEMAFTLGVVGDAAAAPALAQLHEHDSGEVRYRAAEALGRLPEGATTPLERALTDPEAPVRAAAAIALWNRGVKSAVPALVAALKKERDPEAHWRIAYGIARLGDAAGVPGLDVATATAAPWARTFGTRGYRELPAADVAVRRSELTAQLDRILQDPASFWTARVEALRAVARWRGQDESTDAALTELLLAHLAREQQPLVLEVLCAALAEQGGAVEEALLLSLLRGADVPTVRRAAARAYGKCAGERAVATLRALLDGDDVWLRVAATRGLGHGGDAGLDVLRGLLADPESRVRETAMDVVAQRGTAETWSLVRAHALNDASRAVRGTAVTHLAKEKPDGWAQTLVDVFAAATAPDMWECRADILHALAGERELVQPLLERALQDDSPVVRRLARDGLGGAHAAVSDVPPFSCAGKFPLLDPDNWLGNPRIRFTTSKGSFTVDLYLHAAPLHVSNIVHLARTGFYEGLIFHRVVPGFVVQGGDPRHDGWGDAGYHVPDEINQIPFLRGTVGMPKTRDPGSGGCQIFITHLPTPHLDGRYTVFGRVVLGMEVVDALEVGDHILSARVQENLHRGQSASPAAPAE